MTTKSEQKLEIREIELSRLQESKHNSRRHFDEHAMRELVESVKASGVLSPLIVRPVNGKFEIGAGHRRFRAAKLAQLKTVPAVVRKMDDRAFLEFLAIENLQREDLHPLEEAQGYQQLIRMMKYDVAKIAEKVGRSTKYVYDRIKLLALIPQAQKVFLEGKITAGHAILLARLSPKDQKRALDPDERAVFEIEDTLWHPDDDVKPFADLEEFKPRSVRELQGWIDQHVRFDADRDDLPDLFPETANSIKEAVEEAEKIVPITHEHFIQPEARDGQRIVGPRSWKRADGKSGSKSCPHSVLGVVAIGPARGEAFKVCTAKKKCKVHWGTEMAQSAERAKEVAKSGKSGVDRWALQRKKEEEARQREQAKRKRWEKATPELLKAIAQRVKNMPANARSLLAKIVADQIHAQAWDVKRADLEKAVPPGSRAEDLIRHLAFTVIAQEIREWSAYKDFGERAKALGVDARAIVDRVAPKPKEEKVQTSAKTAPAKAAKKGKVKK